MGTTDKPWEPWGALLLGAEIEAINWEEDINSPWRNLYPSNTIPVSIRVKCRDGKTVWLIVRIQEAHTGIGNLKLQPQLTVNVQ